MEAVEKERRERVDQSELWRSHPWPDFLGKFPRYPIWLAIDGRTAHFANPETGDVSYSYSAPTYSALVGVCKSIACHDDAEIFIDGIEICRPVIRHRITSNYYGPLRNTARIAVKAAEQVRLVVLADVCYRVYGHIDRYLAPTECRSEASRKHMGLARNAAHAFQDVFLRRVERGQCFRHPYLGQREMVADYFGPFRPQTKVQRDVNELIPSMLVTAHSNFRFGKFQPTFRQNVEIVEGQLRYA